MNVACYRKKRDPSIVSIVCSITFLVDGYNTGIRQSLWYKNFVQYNNILHLFKSLSRIMAHYSHVIYACYQNILQNLFASC